MRISAAVASSRISELEKHLGVRLFNRTTRSLNSTEHGDLFYKGAIKILDTIDEVEGNIADITLNPKGTVFVSAPLGIGKKLIAPLVPKFKAQYPEIKIRLRLSDRNVDLTNEGLDAAFILGELSDSEARYRPIHNFKRVLCASPQYLEKYGAPEGVDDLLEGKHQCLLLRYPGADEFYWTLNVDGEPQRLDLNGPLESDDGDVLTNWALVGSGIINKPVFEVGGYLDSGELVQVIKDSPPTDLPFACIYPHKRLQDPKIRLFIDFMVEECKLEIAGQTFGTSV